MSAREQTGGLKSNLRPPAPSSGHQEIWRPRAGGGGEPPIHNLCYFQYWGRIMRRRTIRCVITGGNDAFISSGILC